PMLAQGAGDLAEAMALATGGEGRPASVEWKLDGARIQVHREGDDVRIYTRNLNDVTGRLPGVVALVRSLPAEALLLDGAAVGVAAGALPRPSPDTRRAFGREAGSAGAALESRFFGLLHLAGEDLIVRPPTARVAALARFAGPWRIPGAVTTDVGAAERVLEQ